MGVRFDLFKQTLLIRALGWWKVPLLAAVSPSLVELTEARCVVRIPLRRRTKNHLGSMYFGALAIGADLAGGLMAVDLMRKKKAKLSLVFKSFRADFLKRPESDVYFICDEGAKVQALVERALTSPDRQGEVLNLRAAVRTPDGGYDDVATFQLELTLKRSENGSF